MRYWRLVLPLLVYYSPSGMAQSSAHNTTHADDMPSAEMLEYLSEYESVDDETWAILEHHALKDVDSNSTKTNQ